VYLHHGLLMNSEVWICQIEEKLSLPFRLVEEGYDVWFGNNRGNKYSKKSLNHLATKVEFWNFSMVNLKSTSALTVRMNLHSMTFLIQSIIFCIQQELKA
jgi:pimeloyl-ACP methyl ester carboxylesterase